MQLFKDLGSGITTLTSVVIANSATVKPGDAVELTSAGSGAGGVSAINNVGDRVHGIVVGIVTPTMVPLGLATSGTDYDGTFTASTGAYAATSDNETDKKIQAIIVKVQPNMVFRTPFTGSLGANDVVGMYYSINTSDASQIDVATRSATVEQFKLVELPVSDDSYLNVQIIERDDSQ